MAGGQNILYVECLACGHLGMVPERKLPPNVKAAVKPRLRCTSCGTKGRVDVRWVLTLDEGSGS